MQEIAKFILANFNKSTFDGEYNAVFATQSVPALLKYYKIFRSLQPKIKIAAVFTYAANASQDDELTGMNQGFVTDRVAADELQSIMNDYNGMFDTSHSTENFGLYCDEVNKRMKKKNPDMKPLDLLLVVNMFLTGFDAKTLNTLYVDKNLEYHGLVQAFSRTNRVQNEKKRFGKVVCFRDLKNNVDAAIRLFSNNQPNEFIIRQPFEKVKNELNELVVKFKEKYPEVQAVDALQNEYDRRDFVLAFREIIKKRSEIQVYEDFNVDDEELLMSEQEFMDFRSKYLDIAIGPIKPPPEPTIFAEPDIPYGDKEDDTALKDIDFCLELLRSDVINVAYILELMAGLDTNSPDYAQQRQAILDTMIKDAGMRNKTKLVDEFMRENIDNDKEGFAKAKADGTMDLESRLSAFVTRKRGLAVQELAAEEALEEEALQNFLAEYDYLKREKLDIVQEAVRKKKAGLIERRSILDRVVRKLRNIMDIYNWD